MGYPNIRLVSKQARENEALHKIFCERETLLLGKLPSKHRTPCRIRPENLANFQDTQPAQRLTRKPAANLQYPALRLRNRFSKPSSFDNHLSVGPYKTNAFLKRVASDKQFPSRTTALSSVQSPLNGSPLNLSSVKLITTKGTRKREEASVLKRFQSKTPWLKPHVPTPIMNRQLGRVELVSPHTHDHGLGKDSVLGKLSVSIDLGPLYTKVKPAASRLHRFA